MPTESIDDRETAVCDNGGRIRVAFRCRRPFHTDQAGHSYSDANKRTDTVVIEYVVRRADRALEYLEPPRH